MPLKDYWKHPLTIQLWISYSTVRNQHLHETEDSEDTLLPSSSYFLFWSVSFTRKLCRRLHHVLLVRNSVTLQKPNDVIHLLKNSDFASSFPVIGLPCLKSFSAILILITSIILFIFSKFTVYPFKISWVSLARSTDWSAIFVYLGFPLTLFEPMIANYVIWLAFD